MSDQNLSTRARFGLRFSLVARRWRRALDAHLSDSGVTGAIWVPLVHLHETGGGLTQKALALLVGVDSSSLVRIIDILCREGLVERRPDSSDGRAKLVYLTDAGQDRVAKIRAELIQAETEILADLSDDEIETMTTLIGRIDARLVAAETDRKGTKP
ncbi:MarR family transcriptional regulator [Sagittula sp. NFXS13]|uniref:MarR family transcriptional regulator for hemolysin n=1 Tax=Sagittula marina TaxID=943940 RepID=A0A7W6DRV0_9RHOB|nr:MarR family transcriptional regulator [Sagittula marina]MBB3984014.1 MarR family transcriptional regulator for hemolysin [Sagittula marina]